MPEFTYAAAIQSTVGNIPGINIRPALAAPGVLAVMTYRCAPRLYVTVVIAASPEKAKSAAGLIRVEHDEEQLPVEPPATTSAIAIEMAMDELAYTLGADPLELRLKNYAEKNLHSQQPWSARFLRECYTRGRAAAGWTSRNPKPANNQQGGWLVGDGIATASYPTRRKVPGPDVRSMALRMNNQYRRPSAGTRPNAPLPDASLSTFYPLTACGAIFARVLVDPTTGMVRIARLTAYLHIGRVPDMEATRDHVINGMILALGMTHDHVPGQTDMPGFDISFLDKPDPYISRLSPRELGEIGMTGTIAAITNAIFHATGRRIRMLPVIPAPLSHQASDHWSHPAH